MYSLYIFFVEDKLEFQESLKKCIVSVLKMSYFTVNGRTIVQTEIGSAQSYLCWRGPSGSSGCLRSAADWAAHWSDSCPGTWWPLGHVGCPPPGNTQVCLKHKGSGGVKKETIWPSASSGGSFDWTMFELPVPLHLVYVFALQSIYVKTFGI